MNFRKLLILPLLALAANTYCAYTPAKVALADFALEDSARAGAITASLMTYDSDLTAETAAIIKFMNQAPLHLQRFQTAGQQRQWVFYQDMIQLIKDTPGQQATDALNAYARVVLYIYEKKAYLIKASWAPHYLSPIRGIRSPGSFGSANGAGLDQLLNEYDQLATIAMGKDTALGLHMKAITKAYKYWKPVYMALTCAYLLYDIKTRESADSILWNLRNQSQIFKTIKTDIGSAINFVTGDAISKLNLFGTSTPTSKEAAIVKEFRALDAAKNELLKKEKLALAAKAQAAATKLAAEACKEKATEKERIALQALKDFNQQNNWWIVNCIENAQDSVKEKMNALKKAFTPSSEFSDSSEFLD